MQIQVGFSDITFILDVTVYYVLQGRYSVRAVLKDNTNNNVIACVQIKAELKKAGGGGGFLFG